MPTQMGAFKKGWAMIASTNSVERREAAHGRPYDHDRQVVFKNEMRIARADSCLWVQTRRRSASELFSTP
jgi:hypothetical protein